MTSKIHGFIFLAFLLLAPLSWGGSHAPWLFLPNFHHNIRGLEKLEAASIGIHQPPPINVSPLFMTDSGLSRMEQSLVRWHEAEFPHNDFVQMMPENSSFGWYAHCFNVPKPFKGMDLLLYLGIIDDSDETFLNGGFIGGHGKIPNGSAWQDDRIYRISSNHLREKDNLIAVHAWSLWGLGGIVGPPVLKTAVAPKDAQYEIALINDKNAPVKGMNHALSSNDACTLCFSENKPEWAPVGLPWEKFASLPDDVHYMVFRLKFDMFLENGSPRLFKSPVIMDCGPVFDVAAFYLNGKRLGQIGRFQENDEPAFTEAAQRAQFMVPPKAWNKNGQNELLAVVYRESGVGGLTEMPGILIENPQERTFETSCTERVSLTNIYMQSGMTSKAMALLKKFKAKNSREHAWRLSLQTHLAFLQWFDTGMNDVSLCHRILSPLEEIFSNHSAEAPRQSAMQAFCRILRKAEANDTIMKTVRTHFPSFSDKYRFMGIDTQTRGDWLLHYGSAGWILPASNQVADLKSPNVQCIPTSKDMSPSSQQIQYRLEIPASKDTARLWLSGGSRDVSDASALLQHLPFLHYLGTLERLSLDQLSSPLAPNKPIRRSAWWDDHGEMHPFDDEGPDFLVKIQTNQPDTRMSFYVYDYDWWMTRHPRQQSLSIFTSNGDLLNACWIGKSDHGKYVRFNVMTPDIVCRVNKHRSACTSISGVFFDKANIDIDSIQKKCPEHLNIDFSDVLTSSDIDNNLKQSTLKRASLEKVSQCNAPVHETISQILKLEGKTDWHLQHSSACKLVEKLTTVEDIAAIIWHLDKLEFHSYYWKIILVSRCLAIMDIQDTRNIIVNSEYLSRMLGEAYSENWPFQQILIHYLVKKGVSTQSAIVKKITERIPIWSTSNHILDKMEAKHEN